MQIAISITHEFDSLDAFAEFAEKIKAAFADLKSAGAKLANRTAAAVAPVARAPIEPLPLPVQPPVSEPAPLPAAEPVPPAFNDPAPAPASIEPKRKPGRPRKAAEAVTEAPALPLEPAPAPVATEQPKAAPAAPSADEDDLTQDVPFRITGGQIAAEFLAKHGNGAFGEVLAHYNVSRPSKLDPSKRVEFVDVLRRGLALAKWTGVAAVIS